MGLVQFHDAQALFVDRDPGAVGGRHFCQPLDDAVFGRETGVAGALAVAGGLGTVAFFVKKKSS